MGSALAEVGFDAVGFAQQHGDLLLAGIEKALKLTQGLLKLDLKLGIFLIPPGLAQCNGTALELLHSLLKVGVERFEGLGKPAKLFRISDCFGHTRVYQRQPGVVAFFWQMTWPAGGPILFWSPTGGSLIGDRLLSRAHSSVG